MIDTSGTLNGTWHKKVRSGRYVDLRNPTPGIIDISDISFSLHNQCRYTGHVDFYSVAEHSILACELAVLDGCSDWELRAILLHDAAEVYLSDVSRPLKLYLRSIGVTVYDELSKKWDDAIGEKFGIDLQQYHGVIKKYDNMMLKAEKARFWPGDTEEWEGLSSVADSSPRWRNFLPSSDGFLSWHTLLWS